MSTVLLAFFTSKFGGYVLAGLGGVGALIFSHFRAYEAGKVAVIAKQAEATVSAVKERHDVEATVGALSDDAVREQLRFRWGK